MNRRGFITGLVSLVAAPAIVRASSLMPVRRVLILPPAPALGPSVDVLYGTLTFEPNWLQRFVWGDDESIRWHMNG